MLENRGLHVVAARLAPCVLAFVAVGCGAKTGLLLPDADATVDAEVFDAPLDVPPDVCVPDRVGIELRRGQVIFVIDRSWSMSWNLEGGEARPGERTRWDLLRDALGDVLPPAEALLEMGAKFYPIEMTTFPDVPDDLACAVDSGIDLEPAPNNTSELLDFFVRSPPMSAPPWIQRMTGRALPPSPDV